jgi:hypothetical protein
MNHLIPATIQRQLWDFGAWTIRHWGAHHWQAVDSRTLQFKVRALYFTGHIRITALGGISKHRIQLGHWRSRSFQCLQAIERVPDYDLVHELDAWIGHLAQYAA